ncbi:hypothetical protein B0A49_12457 [Cryomyces minteri]|uniref:PNPLA domain-containing protein n=1 Tax=Cryomyces minteri TaxID=331657 RepID=A0A4U0WEQ4_9PEZI|nr:hypothetical protein B0A49_12457 [Cryomyces minteri]
MAGTSTGGLSAIMLGRMDMCVEKALEQYDLVGNKVFGKPRRLHSRMKLANLLRPEFPARNMESAMNLVIKSGLEDEIRQWRHFRTEEVPFQSDSQKCRTLVVAHGPVNISKTVHHTYIFRTYDHLHPSPMSDRENRTKHLNPGRAHRDPIWKIARATSAAPGYFSPIDFGGRTFRDGGMVANNPSTVMYYRFNVGNGLGDIPLDQWKPANSGEKTKSTIEESTFEYLADPETHSQLLRFAAELVSVRRARAATVRWETFAREFIYCCTEAACLGAQASRTFLTRDELRDHGVQVHSFVLNVALEGSSHDSCQYVCTFDQCHDGGVHVFDDQRLFEEHLRQAHDLEHPQFMDLRALEQWLDLGRMTQQAALKCRPSEMARKKREEREEKKATAVADAVAAGLVRGHSIPRRGRKTRESLSSTLPALRLDTDFATSSQPNSAAMIASPSSIPVTTPTASANTLVNEVRGSS